MGSSIPRTHACQWDLFPAGIRTPTFYWDDFHPTARAHSIIGSEFAAAVPEPEIGAMLVIGLTVVGFAARQRRKTEQERIGKRGASNAGGV